MFSKDKKLIHEFKYAQGLEAKDKITGFKGIITARYNFITGCDQYALTAQQGPKDGKLGDIYQFDEGRIEILGPGINEKEVKASKGKGGPQPLSMPSK